MTRPASGASSPTARLTRRALAGAVRSEQPEHLAARDGERQSVDGDERAVLLANVFKVQHWRDRDEYTSGRAGRSRSLPPAVARSGAERSNAAVERRTIRSRVGVGLEIVIILLLVLANGVFAMSEIAVVAARKIRLQQRAEEGDHRAEAALALANAPAQFLSTVQFGITLVGILAGAYGGARLSAPLAEFFRGIPQLVRLRGRRLRSASSSPPSPCCR